MIVATTNKFGMLSACKLKSSLKKKNMQQKQWKKLGWKHTTDGRDHSKSRLIVTGPNDGKPISKWGVKAASKSKQPNQRRRKKKKKGNEWRNQRYGKWRSTESILENTKQEKAPGQPKRKWQTQHNEHEYRWMRGDNGDAVAIGWYRMIGATEHSGDYGARSKYASSPEPTTRRAHQPKNSTIREN